MTQRERLIARIRARPAEADADDVIALVDMFGWRLDRQAGSHMIFVKPGESLMSIPLVSGRRVKRIYLNRLSRRLGLDDLP